MITQIDNNRTATGPRVVLDLTYDNLSRLTSQAATVSSTDDFLNSYTYNAASQLTKITQEGQSGGNSVAAKRVDFTYSATGQLSAVDRYANLTGTQLVATSTWGYDNNGRATSLTDTQGSTTFASRTWTYDNIGRLTAEAESVLSVSDSYTYDATGQVTAATHSGGGNESYSYDANGNRTNTGYTTTTDNKLTSDGTYNYTYDNEGNLTRKTTIVGGAYVTYTWDYRNRLTDVSSYTSTNTLTMHLNYVYDVFNRLIEKQVDPTGGGTYTTKQDFLYDVSGNIVLVYNVSGTLTDRVLNGLDANQAWADESGAGTVSWLLTDRLGTVNDVIRYNSGTGITSVVDHLTYGSFGNITAQSNSANQPLFAYTGQIWDADAGLYYYHARWYNAGIGRFISRDPTGFAAGDTDLYRYVWNSPLNYRDPTGLAAVAPTPSLQDFLPPGYVMGVDFLNDPVFRHAYAQWLATITPQNPSAANSQWVDWYANHFNGTFGTLYSQSVGNVIYGAGSLAFSDADMASLSDAQLVAGTAVAAAGIAGAGYGIGALYAGAGAGTAGTAGAAGTTGVAAGTASAGITGAGVAGSTATIGTTVGATLPIVVTASQNPKTQQIVSAASQGMGNIGSHMPVPANTLLSGAHQWLGAGYRTITPGIYRSADNLRQFRMMDVDLLGTHRNSNGPHVHFQALDAAGNFIENFHVPYQYCPAISRIM